MPVVGVGLPIIIRAYPVADLEAYPVTNAYLGLVVHEVRGVVDRIAYLTYLALALDRGDALAGTEAHLFAYPVPTSTRKEDCVPPEFLDDGLGSPTPRGLSGLFRFISFHGFEKGY